MPSPGVVPVGGDPEPAPPRTPLAAVGLAVFAGGLLGGLAREGLTTVWPGGTLPWAVLTINVVGAFLLGAIVEVVTARSLHRHPVLAVRVARPVLGTGFCGGFTTFSSLAVALDVDVRDGRPGVALAYLGLSVGLGLAGVVTGSVVGRTVTR